MVKDFKTKEEAFEWLYTQVDDPNCIDNDRFAFTQNEDECTEYDSQVADGCCGFLDVDITIMGVPAKIGLNYGH